MAPTAGHPLLPCHEVLGLIFGVGWGANREFPIRSHRKRMAKPRPSAPPVPSSDVLWDPEGQLWHQVSLANTPCPATAPSFRAGKATLAGHCHRGRLSLSPSLSPPGPQATGTAPRALTPCLCFHQSPTPRSCVSTAETPPHPFTSGRGTLDPWVFCGADPELQTQHS